MMTKTPPELRTAKRGGRVINVQALQLESMREHVKHE